MFCCLSVSFLCFVLLVGGLPDFQQAYAQSLPLEAYRRHCIFSRSVDFPEFSSHECGRLALGTKKDPLGGFYGLWDLNLRIVHENSVHFAEAFPLGQLDTSSQQQ